MEMNIQDTAVNYLKDQLMYCREAEIVPRRLKGYFLMLIDEDAVAPAVAFEVSSMEVAVVEAASPQVGVDLYYNDKLGIRNLSETIRVMLIPKIYDRND